MTRLATQPNEGAAPVQSWLVDGYNVLHACILKGRERRHWWSAEAQAKVLSWLDSFAAEHDVVVVFDASDAPRERGDEFGTEQARASRVEPEGEARYRARVHYAPDADDELVRLAKAAGAKGCVVSADRALRDRCTAVGCRALRPWAFAELIAGETCGEHEA